MSSESDKPFVCPIAGCGQRFANNDHLAVHRSKHEFSLKIGGRQAVDGLLVDQTPTPTRFLRNCEESGLFQELEANPFDQDFHKVATAAGKHSDGEDPSEAMGKSVDVATMAVPLRSRGMSIPVAPPASITNPDKPVPMATAPPHIANTSTLAKQKLLASIQLKEQQRLLEQTLAAQLQGQPHEILAQALRNATAESPKKSYSDTEVSFAIPDQGLGSAGKRRRGRKPDEDLDPDTKRQRFLERNRAAASRCRAKKKVWVDSLEKKSKDIESINSSLQQEVLMLRSEVQQLKSILIAHKDCPLIVHQAVTPAKTLELTAEGVTHPLASSAVTLLSQLASMPSMSPLISSPVPSVGSVVPNINAGMPPATIIITTNGSGGVDIMAPDIAKDVEIAADAETQTSIEQ